ncbi:hypothetical protein STEG23_027000 [Scotinomys teguina]
MIRFALRTYTHSDPKDLSSVFPILPEILRTAPEDTQPPKLLVISEYGTIGELGIQDHSSAFELLSGVSSREWQRSQLSDRLEISQSIVLYKQFAASLVHVRVLCENDSLSQWNRRFSIENARALNRRMNNAFALPSWAKSRTDGSQWSTENWVASLHPAEAWPALLKWE